MRTGSHTSWSGFLIITKVTLGGSQYRALREEVLADSIAVFVGWKLGIAVLVADFHHLDVVIGTVACTGRTPDARIVIDDDLPTVFTVDGARRARNHTDRIVTMETSLHHLNALLTVSISDKARIAIVG